MSKRSKGGVNVWYCGAAVLALVAIVMMFVTNLNIVGKITEETHYACNGIQTTFGFKDGSIEVYSFSIMNLITYLLLIVGFVIILLRALNVVNSKVADFVAICALVVSGIFFFLMPSFAVCPYANALVVIKLGIGAIIAGVLAIVSAILVAAKMLLKK